MRKNFVPTSKNPLATVNYIKILVSYRECATTVSPHTQGETLWEHVQRDGLKEHQLKLRREDDRHGNFSMKL